MSTKTVVIVLAAVVGLEYLRGNGAVTPLRGGPVSAASKGAAAQGRVLPVSSLSSKGAQRAPASNPKTPGRAFGVAPQPVTRSGGSGKIGALSAGAKNPGFNNVQPKSTIVLAKAPVSKAVYRGSKPTLMVS